jgi:hypothetical protein
VENNVFVLDDRAKQSYKNKVAVLLSDIEEAEAMSHSEKVDTLREEYENLVDHLSKSLGFGGKIRKMDSPVERARAAVTWRIRSAINKIKKAHPDLGKHLSQSVNTGTFCSYAPEKEGQWSL